MAWQKLSITNSDPRRFSDANKSYVVYRLSEATDNRDRIKLAESCDHKAALRLLHLLKSNPVPQSAQYQLEVVARKPKRYYDLEDRD